MAIELEPEYGGTGSTFFSAVLAIEELAKVDASVSVVCDVQNTLIMDFFRSYASKELKEKYLPQLAVDVVCLPTCHKFREYCVGQVELEAVSNPCDHVCI